MQNVLQGTATTSGDVAHDLSKAKALSNALSVMCGERPLRASHNKYIVVAMQKSSAPAH